MGDPEPGPADSDVYLDAPYASVYWDQQHRCVHSVWKAFFEGQEFRDAYAKVELAIVQHKATRYLADSRDRGLISVADQDWVDKVWIPRMVALGITHVAVVLPPGAIGRMSIANAMRPMEDTAITSAAMETVEEAILWLNRA